MARFVRVLADLAHRDLVRAPGALDLLAVDRLGAGPALGRPEHDHRPARALGDAALAGRLLDPADLLDHGVHRGGQLLVDVGRVVALDEVGPVAVALHQRRQLVPRDAGEDRRVGDLVAVEVEDRQDGAVRHRVEELVGVPAGRQRPGLRLAVADDRADQQVRVVERRAVRVRERVAQLAALVDGARRLRRDVAGDAARERELAEQLADAVLVARDAGVDLAVGPLEVGVGDDGRPAVPGADDVDRVEVPVPDHAVHVRVDHVQARASCPSGPAGAA